VILCYTEQPGKETTGRPVGSPSPVSIIEMALEGLEHFERLERLGTFGTRFYSNQRLARGIDFS
jgi:hypothetical protein